MIQLTNERFEELVADALDEIPEGLARRMDNVGVFVDDRSPPGRLFGLYVGTPLTDRHSYGIGVVMPDRITIFKQTICASCSTEDAVREQVRVTVIHEVAHHFGIDDDRLNELGWA